MATSCGPCASFPEYRLIVTPSDTLGSSVTANSVTFHLANCSTIAAILFAALRASKSGMYSIFNSVPGNFSSGAVFAPGTPGKPVAATILGLRSLSNSRCLASSASSCALALTAIPSAFDAAVFASSDFLKAMPESVFALSASMPAPFASSWAVLADLEALPAWSVAIANKVLLKSWRTLSAEVVAASNIPSPNTPMITSNHPSLLSISCHLPVDARCSISSTTTPTATMMVQTRSNRKYFDLISSMSPLKSLAIIEAENDLDALENALKIMATV
ncbi:hypothetical protein SBA7_1160005 [Candidatus Sulfotelmatobacter sp. SbA7]|nr:hypothetical protein SBA7_1160005 [Candidatus Sulfotelmatobacter sp. SbA7]